MSVCVFRNPVTREEPVKPSYENWCYELIRRAEQVPHTIGDGWVELKHLFSPCEKKEIVTAHFGSKGHQLISTMAQRGNTREGKAARKEMTEIWQMWKEFLKEE